MRGGFFWFCGNMTSESKCVASLIRSVLRMKPWEQTFSAHGSLNRIRTPNKSLEPTVNALGGFIFPSSMAALSLIKIHLSRGSNWR
jgi:hypothetical protein